MPNQEQAPSPLDGALEDANIIEEVKLKLREFHLSSMITQADFSSELHKISEKQPGSFLGFQVLILNIYASFFKKVKCQTPRVLENDKIELLLPEVKKNIHGLTKETFLSTIGKSDDTELIFSSFKELLLDTLELERRHVYEIQAISSLAESGGLTLQGLAEIELEILKSL